MKIYEFRYKRELLSEKGDDSIHFNIVVSAKDYPSSWKKAFDIAKECDPDQIGKYGIKLLSVEHI